METVDDKTGREAIDLVTAGHVDMQRQMGVAVPSHVFAEIFARAVVEKQVRKHEERPTASSMGHLSEKDPSTAKAAIDRGDVGENTTVINREIGTADFHRGKLTPNPHHPLRVEKVGEDKALRARLDFLITLPDWKEKIDKAKLEGEAMAMARLRRGAISYGMKEIMSIIADYVIAVADQSNNVFGDYRVPKSARVAPIVFGPLK